MAKWIINGKDVSLNEFKEYLKNKNEDVETEVKKTKKKKVSKETTDYEKTIEVN